MTSGLRAPNRPPASVLSNGFVAAGAVTSTSPNLEVRGDVKVTNGDLIIDGVSMKTLLEGVVDRLHILIPDPAKLEKYESLKRVYAEYKLIEALCREDQKS